MCDWTGDFPEGTRFFRYKGMRVPFPRGPFPPDFAFIIYDPETEMTIELTMKELAAAEILEQPFI